MPSSPRRAPAALGLAPPLAACHRSDRAADRARQLSFVLAQPAGEWIFRQLVPAGAAWRLRPLNPAYPTLDLPDLPRCAGS